jgi:hypothetical protein
VNYYNDEINAVLDSVDGPPGCMTLDYLKSIHDPDLVDGCIEAGIIVVFTIEENPKLYVVFPTRLQVNIAPTK